KSPPKEAPAIPAAKPGDLPAFRLGALLPLTGTGAWFGKEIRQGIELAMSDLNARRADAAESGASEEEAVSASRLTREEGLPAAGVPFSLEAANVPPLDVKRAAEEFSRLAAMSVAVVFTASATPALAIHSLAAARNILVFHEGIVTGRFPPASRTLVYARPSVASIADAVLADAAAQKVRRLGLLAAGDEFGKAIGAAVAARWRERGGTLAVEESLVVEASDLTARLRQVVRAAPEAIALGFRGPDLGDLAARLREAGYKGQLYLL